MKEYESKTKPLLDEFQKMGVLINYETKKGVKDYPELKKIIEDRIAKSSQKAWLQCICMISLVISHAQEYGDLSILH